MANINVHSQDKRKTLFPIYRHNIWKFYKTMLNLSWHSEEIIFKNDSSDYEGKLSDAEKRIVRYIFAIFARFEEIVRNMVSNDYKQGVPYIEAEFAYTAKEQQECIHSETYNRQIEETILDNDERHNILSSIDNYPAVRELAEWVAKYAQGTDRTLAERLVGEVCTEGIIFSAQFALIYWFRDRGLLSGTAQANELISRDENLHAMLDICILHDSGMMKELNKDIVYDTFKSCTKVIADFIEEMMEGQDLPNMKRSDLQQYVHYVADYYLTEMGFAPLFRTENPFVFMRKLALQNKTNFFEGTATEYNKVPDETSIDDVKNLTNF